jgi:predicted aspartyl protease
MAHQLNFSIRHHFVTPDFGITVPVQLERDGRITFCEARVDTGSEYCFFQRELADALGLDVLEGEAVNINTLAGRLTAYAHTVELETLGIRFESVVLFTAAYGSPRNLLGRRGWLNNLHLGLTMDDETIYLNPAYGSENL